jgi:serine/threonine protein kinase
VIVFDFMFVALAGGPARSPLRHVEPVMEQVPAYPVAKTPSESLSPSYESSYSVEGPSAGRGASPEPPGTGGGHLPRDWEYQQRNKKTTALSFSEQAPDADHESVASQNRTQREAVQTHGRSETSRSDTGNWYLTEDAMEYSDTEDAADYRSGGYHPIQIGDALKNGRYIVLRKLGWGHFSTVWLCWDEERSGLVALKIQKSARHYTDAARDEIALLATIREKAPLRGTPVVTFLDHFELIGPNGRHVCLVFEVLGRSLLSLIRYHGYRGVPLPIAKRVIVHLLEALDFCHRDCGIIHTDVKPENCLFVPPREATVELAGQAISEALSMFEQRYGPILHSFEGQRSSNAQVDLSDVASNSKPKLVLDTPNAKRPQSEPDALCAPTFAEPERACKPKSEGMPPFRACAAVADRLQTQISDQVQSGLTEELITCNEDSDPARIRKTYNALRAALNTVDAEVASQRDLQSQSTELIHARTQFSGEGPTLTSASLSSISEQSQASSSNASMKFTKDAHGGVVSCLAYLKEKDPMRMQQADDAATACSVDSGYGALSTMTTTAAADRMKPSAAQQLATVKHPGGARTENGLAALSGCTFNIEPTRPLAWHGWETNSRVKLVDFGNACWTDKHFTEDIQTRQYRSPEVILGAGFDASADIWSCACVLFELLTGDFLFDPHSGRSFSRDDDHLALMMELLGPFPRSLLDRGKYSGEYFTKDGALRKIKSLHFWSLSDLLREKYKFPRHEAEEIAMFLEPMLRLEPMQRATAAQCLQHPWLSDVYAGAARQGMCAALAVTATTHTSSISPETQNKSADGNGSAAAAAITEQRVTQLAVNVSSALDLGQSSAASSSRGSITSPEAAERRTPESLRQRLAVRQHSNYAPSQTLFDKRCSSLGRQSAGCL